MSRGSLAVLLGMTMACCGVVLVSLAVQSQAQEDSRPPTAPADLKQLRDITGIEELPAVESPWRWLPWLAGGLALGGGLLLAGWKYRGRPQPVAPTPPDQWAQAELKRIDELGLDVPREADRYHTLVSDVVRRYLELRFELRASRQTTAEFLEAMRHSTLLTTPQQEELREFLQRCDLAKFARADVAAEDCNEVAAMARQLVTPPV